MSDDDGGDSSSGQVQSFKEMASEVRSNDDDDDVGPKDDDELLGNPTSMIESVKAKQAEKAAGKKKTKQQPVKYSWTTEAVDALIREWEVRPNLFDSSHKEYHLKDKRKITVEQIRRKLESDDQIDPAPSDDDIVKKMHNLRTYFNAERNKEEASKSTGKGAEDLYESQWQFYKQLAFLSDNVAPRTTHSNIQKLDRAADAPTHSKKSRKNEPDTSDKLAGALIDYMKRPSQEPAKPTEASPPAKVQKTPGMLFGELVAEIFDDIPKGYHRDMMKMEVQKIMYETKYRAELNQSGDFGTPLNVQTNSYPQRNISTPLYHHSPASRHPPLRSPSSSLSSPEGNTTYRAQIPYYNPLAQLGAENGDMSH